MKANVTSRKSSNGSRIAVKDNRAAIGLAAKPSKKWRFAPDAIGMFNGPRDLSRRKGLSG